MQTIKMRNSNIELLRILCILLIISFHYVFKGGFVYETFCLNEYITKIFWMFGELGVNCFMIITGYFMVQQCFKFRKVILLWLEIQFYNILVLFIVSRLGLSSQTATQHFILELFPVFRDKWWFATVYLILYLFSPFMQRFAKCMSKREYIKFLLLCLTLWSVIPTLLGIFYNTTEGFLYYTRFLWLTVIWFTGAFIRLHGMVFIRHLKVWNYIFLVVSIIIFSSILFIEYLGSFFTWLGTTETAYFWRPNSIPMYILSISLFALFLNIKFPFSKLINRAASTTLGIYLLHDSRLSEYLWNTVFKNNTHMFSPVFILHILSATAVLFLLGVTVDLIRQYLERNVLLKILDFFSIKYSRRIRLKVSEILDQLEKY